jgi:hypothetical protein
MSPMTSSFMALAFLMASVRMKTAFAFVSPIAFSCGQRGCEPRFENEKNEINGRQGYHKTNENNSEIRKKMTTIYMTSTMAGTNATATSFPETGGRVLGTGADDKVVQAIVPFGGSAPAVPNPNKSILGGKGIGLQEMSSIGIAVPPGFTLTTPLCQVFQDSNDLPEEVWAEIENAIKVVEADMGRKFGDSENPLLFSCRSGAAVSMPGMMDTVLNIVSTFDIR